MQCAENAEHDTTESGEHKQGGEAAGKHEYKRIDAARSAAAYCTAITQL